MRKINSFLYLIPLGFALCCQPDRKMGNDLLFSKNNLVAWCIVPFDSLERNPEQRASMLNDLGITQLAYDWRSKHLATFPDEVAALKNHHIGLKSVWLWIESDSAKTLGHDNERMLELIRGQNVKTDFWVGFSNRYFEGLTDEQKLNKAILAVQNLDQRAKEIGCRINLYNHGDWFGNPVNQVNIITSAGLTDVGIIYNFHHAHDQVKDFPDALKQMLPFLRGVNINGMKKGGPQILPIGQGDQELEMLSILKRSGYNGPIGILGHIPNVDVKKILEGNLSGLKSVLKIMGDDQALATY